MKFNLFFSLSLIAFIIIGLATQFSTVLKIIILCNSIIVLISAFKKLWRLFNGRKQKKN